MFRSIGWQELAIVLVIVLILFGPKRLPQLGKMFGKTMRQIRDGVEGKLDSADEDEIAAPGKAEADAEKVASSSNDKDAS
jgi:sec-independent protein translocase protein TatA